MAVTVMQRREMKYLMDERQTAYLRRRLEGHLQVDEYGLTTTAGGNLSIRDVNGDVWITPSGSGTEPKPYEAKMNGKPASFVAQ